MNHHLSKISIKNFRSCKDIDINFSSFTPLIGYNNAGKSTILNAIEWLFKKKLLSSDDYTNPDNPIEVIGTVKGITEDILSALTEENRTRISPYIIDEALIFKRQQPVGAQSAKDVRLLIKNPENNEFRTSPTGIENAIKALFPDPIRIGAMENAADDSSKSKTGTTIGKLLAELSCKIEEKHTQMILSHLNAVNRRMTATGNKRISDLNDIDDSISSKVADFFPGISLKLHFELPDFKDIFKSGTVKVYEDSFPGIARDCSSYGHGTQRSIQMALIRHLADITNGDDIKTTTLLLIDEPELYLHPFAIEQIRESLKTLSHHGYQIIFSTHSSQMITSDLAKDTVLIRKNSQRGTHCRLTLKEAVNKVIEQRPAQATHLFSLTQSSKVLFANNVILTEGKTETTLLPFIFNKVKNKTLGQMQIALIETGSVESISKTMQILNSMDIPTKAIVDLDFAFRGAIRNNFLEHNDEDILRLKEILRSMHANGECTLDGSGLPTRGSNTTAAEAFAIMSQKPGAREFLSSLAAKLRNANIWIWLNGSIENHLGLTEKNESVWADFKTKADTQPLSDICADFESIEALVDWITPDV
ncbi:TPA: AAA family ATPase [Escherichia coli]|uniref:ATP-dependent nuclease n=1 Tax=Escherichia coli TaxID=562 RepID=UPI0006A5E029|nr:AAA family ATPase [Escherichia coli]HCT2016471.1 AAA family ATPase [Escherichia coli]HDQ0085651.1 AAA family ATPase [Escherichia coli]HDQ1404289.1 AAA family ATPase [Escherichia coli]HEB5782590.1 AAA family ATPase [Escherichia coli]